MDMAPLFPEKEGIYFDKKGKLKGNRKEVQKFKGDAAAGQLQIDLDAEAMGLNDPYLDPFDKLKTGQRVGFDERFVNKESPLFKKFDKAPEMSSVITNQKEGDAFRAYVVENFPDYAKSMYSDGLSKSGKFDNKYIKKAYDDYGLEYANYQRGY